MWATVFRVEDESLLVFEDRTEPSYCPQRETSNDPGGPAENPEHYKGPLGVPGGLSKSQELRRPQAGQLVVRKKGAPTRIRGVGVKSELGMWKAERQTYEQMGLFRLPPKICMARLVPGHRGDRRC